LTERSIRLILTEAAVDHLAEVGYDPKMGARPLSRKIDELIRVPLSRKIIFDKLQDCVVTVDYQDTALTFNNEANVKPVLDAATVDENGIIEKVNLIIATGNNNLAMNQTVTQIAKHYIHNNDVSEGFLNRVEAGIRCYDPCLSCSTHAAGQMPLQVEIVDSQGTVINSLRRN
jgi:hypothetical protein